MASSSTPAPGSASTSSTASVSSTAGRRIRPPLLGPLIEQVENLYTNNYVLPLNTAWQQWVDGCERWEAKDVHSQAAFYEIAVRPFLLRNNKVAVIISDALRYEAAEELLRLVRQEDRYDAEIEPLLGVLPSFTQLGMAALLPHEQLALTPDGAVMVDGAPSQGTEYRKAILDRALPRQGHGHQGRGTARPRPRREPRPHA